VVPLCVLELRAERHDRWFPWVLGSGFDQLQYFAWTREIGDHFLASNLFRIGPSRHVFTDPFFVVTGGLHFLGLSVPLAFWLLAPAAVLAIWLGPFRWAVARLGSPSAAAVAVLLAIFYFAPVYVLLDWVGADAAGLGEAAGPLFIAPLLWGGLPGVIAVGLVPAVLLLVERHRVLLAAALALLLSWMHPWQGEQIVLVLAGAIALDRRPLRERIPLALPVVASLPPVAYFALLAHYDYDWKLARNAAHSTHPGAWQLAGVLAPLSCSRSSVSGPGGATTWASACSCCCLSLASSRSLPRPRWRRTLSLELRYRWRSSLRAGGCAWAGRGRPVRSWRPLSSRRASSKARGCLTAMSSGRFRRTRSTGASTPR
jgi:hypothetical protein